MGHWKAVIGSKLMARNFENQRTEAEIDAHVSNTPAATRLGKGAFPVTDDLCNNAGALVETLR